VKFKILYFVVLFYSYNSQAQLEDSLDYSFTNTMENIGEIENEETINGIVSYAKQFLGTPYKFAGTSPIGFDCSGFIYYVMGNFGFNITRSSYGMAEFGETVRLSEVKPGDLLFFKGRNINSKTVGHVALVVENNEGVIKMIHASTSSGVTIDTFTNNEYYVPRFLKAKRLDYAGL
jgi:cell wall-associated NlpC family hydrolase